MPKIIAHALTGSAIIAAIHPKVKISNLTPIFIGMILAISSDFDIALEWLFEIPDLHRGFTHSLAFSLAIGLALSLWMHPGKEKEALTYSLAYLSHPILDLITSTSGGVKLLYPFSTEYYHLGLTGIFELPIGTDLTQVIAWFSIELSVFVPILLLVIAFRYFSARISWLRQN
jgi:membrane-bound metal-dependent hydrolase YbcI (DUF457 family)